MTETEITEARFRSLLTQAKLLGPSDYVTGYQRGLRRRYHGARFGTADEHRLWLQLGLAGDEDRAELGRGYRDGFDAAAPSFD